MEKLEGWNVIDAEAGVLWREYEFTKGGFATTLVFRGSDGLVVVSPSSHLAAAEYDALRQFGEVRALVANNTLHHFGQRPWLAHFKDAKSYCPPGAIEKLNKKVEGVRFRPLSELALPPQVRWLDAPGFKTGETILSVRTAKGPVWYTGDLLTNIQGRQPLPFRWLLKWTDSAPGFRLFRLAVWLGVNDKPALREFMLARVAEDPPAMVVPAHGPPVDPPDLATQVKTQLERL